MAVIPARYGSERLPGKPLLILGTKPLIQHLYERVASVSRFERVLVATDDDRVSRCVAGFGGEAVMTSSQHWSGSDRVAAATENDSSPLIMNVQGDQPFLDPQGLEALLDYAERNPRFPVYTPAAPIRLAAELANPSVVKVVTGHYGQALYFSRYPIPYARDLLTEPTRACDADKTSELLAGFDYLRHIGIYLYRKTFLRRFTAWSPGPLEKTEKLEQLRILEQGHAIAVVRVGRANLTVDTPEDYARACAQVSDHKVAYPCLDKG